MGVHTSVDTLGTCGRHLVMVEMCSAPQNAHILTAQTPLGENCATFLKTISFWDTLYKVVTSILETSETEELLRLCLKSSKLCRDRSNGAT